MRKKGRRAESSMTKHFKVIPRNGKKIFLCYGKSFCTLDEEKKRLLIRAKDLPFGAAVYIFEPLEPIL